MVDSVTGGYDISRAPRKAGESMRKRRNPARSG